MRCPSQMGYDREVHHRRSIRLRGYDYARPGAYFVTVCTHAKGHLFGDVEEGQMKPNAFAETVRLSWTDLPRHYPNIRLDSFVVMPNHVHGIIEMVGAGLYGRVCKPAPTHALSEIVRGFKTFSARSINGMRGTPGRPVWQRNYYEHIIRDAKELAVIREYIATNPVRWDTDPENVM